MKNKRTTDYILAGLFIVTMGGVILYALKYRSSSLPELEGQRDISGSSKEDDSFISGLSNKIESIIEGGEQNIHNQETRFSMPAGELGLFL